MTADINHPFLNILKEKLALDRAALYVPVEPEPSATVDNCFLNVRRKIQRHGGDIVHGWQVWQTPFYIEAVYHGVWQSIDGALVDITPKGLPGVSRILFLPEPERIYAGRQVDNVRLNTTNNPLVEDVFALSRAIFNFQNDGKRATQHDLFLTAAEVKYIQTLFITREQVLKLLYKGGSRRSTCFCRSDKPYEKCHGDGLLELLGTSD